MYIQCPNFLRVNIASLILFLEFSFRIIDPTDSYLCKGIYGTDYVIHFVVLHKVKSLLYLCPWHDKEMNCPVWILMQLKISSIQFDYGMIACFGLTVADDNAGFFCELYLKIVSWEQFTQAYVLEFMPNHEHAVPKWHIKSSKGHVRVWKTKTETAWKAKHCFWLSEH